MTIRSCSETYDEMTRLTSDHKLIRNFHQDIQILPYLVVTELFPEEALEAYTAWNLGQKVSETQMEKYFSAHRGGAQGDYRDGMQSKILNVVDCLLSFPKSKRAVITIPNESAPPHSDDAAAKCMRELHFYLDGDRLNGTVYFRAQAAEIFPKNIHFIGALFEEIAHRLGKNISSGMLHYVATTLVSDRL